MNSICGKCLGVAATSHFLVLVSLLLLGFATDATGQVGKRIKLEGKASADPPNAPANPSIRIGNLHLTQAGSRHWKSDSMDSLLKEFPDEKSLYVVGNFSGTTAKLRAEIDQMGDGTRIIWRQPTTPSLSIPNERPWNRSRRTGPKTGSTSSRP